MELEERKGMSFHCCLIVLFFNSHADKVEESGWVPKNYILIFDKILSEKTARRDYHIEGNNSLSFSRGDHIQIYKESQGWAVGRAGEKIGYFPLKYLEA